MAQIVVGILFIIIIFMSIWFIYFYNKMTNKKIDVDKSWTKIYLQIIKRSDLIPDFLELASCYEIYDQEKLKQLLEMKNSIIDIEIHEEIVKEANVISKLLAEFLIIDEPVEQCSDISVNADFMSRKQQLKEIEEKLSVYYDDYNNEIFIYNRFAHNFCSKATAAILGIKEMALLEKLK